MVGVNKMDSKKLINLNEMFVEEVRNNNMTPIEILNYYRNFYYKEDDDTEQYIMAKAINDIFMCFKGLYGSSEKNVLEMLEERYSKQTEINNNTYLEISIGTPPIIPKSTKLSDVLNYALRGENKNEE